MEVLGGWLRQYAPIAAVIAVPAVLLWALLVIRRGDRGLTTRRTIREAGADVLLALSLFAILALTILPGTQPSGPASGRSLVPFEDLARSLQPGMPAYATDLAVANLVANLLLFLPFGFALGLRFPTARWWRPLLVVVALSVSIELVQLLAGMGRSADVTDVLTNTLGGLLGWVAARIVVGLARTLRAR
ncbi:MAG: VanZ family protein [Chloroflexota bacterium]